MAHDISVAMFVFLIGANWHIEVWKSPSVKCLVECYRFDKIFSVDTSIIFTEYARIYSHWAHWAIFIGSWHDWVVFKTLRHVFARLLSWHSTATNGPVAHLAENKCDIFSSELCVKVASLVHSHQYISYLCIEEQIYLVDLPERRPW